MGRTQGLKDTPILSTAWEGGGEWGFVLTGAQIIVVNKLNSFNNCAISNIRNVRTELLQSCGIAVCVGLVRERCIGGKALHGRLC